mgnify:CR=1 FL=1
MLATDSRSIFSVMFLHTHTIQISSKEYLFLLVFAYLYNKVFEFSI